MCRSGMTSTAGIPNGGTCTDARERRGTTPPARAAFFWTRGKYPFPVGQVFNERHSKTNMSYRHRTAAIIVVVALSSMGTGFVMGNLHAQWPQPNAAHDEIAAALDGVRASEAPAHDTSALALSDMHSYALRHIGVFDVDPRSLRASSEWSPRWQLHWMDVHHDQHTTRIYHAIDNENPSRRFTTMWMGAQTEWERSY